jgi:2-polyprenyl-6-methoxyphenol hydroxylase-like FAD-dependent oxidoreductase
MQHYPVVIAGAGPVGMTLARALARWGIRCLVAERNPGTTRHPKMDITNGRSMEIFRRLGLAGALRAVAVAEANNFDVSWITDLSGHELHRFRYPSVTEARAAILARNDGTQSLEPAMRVSQVKIEPVLRDAILGEPLVEARWGLAFEAFAQDADGVTVTLRRADGGVEQVRADYLAGCDGGGSLVRQQLGVGLEGQHAVMPRYMVHFRSDAREVLQRWGIAWHYQSAFATIIAQDDFDTWTLQCRFPPGVAPESADPSAMLRQFAGRDFPHEILVANHWTPHLVVAESYGAGRVFLAGDSAHQVIPTGGYGMNTGIGDALDLGWKLAAVLRGFGGPTLLESYGAERLPVGQRNRDASGHHTKVRIAIGALYTPELWEPGAEAARAAAGTRIAELGNAENESWGVEFGYAYPDSPVICGEAGAAAPDDPLRYEPTTVPGVRLPSVFLADGSALYDRLGPWFSLLCFGVAPSAAMVDAAARLGVPLTVLRIDEPELAPIYQAPLVLVRPDQHVAWRGAALEDRDAAEAVLRRVLGWQALRS